MFQVRRWPLGSRGYPMFQVRRWPLCSRGLLFDREWMIVTESGIGMSQKREPKLCLLRPTLDLLSETLTLEYPGTPFCDVFSYLQTYPWYWISYPGTELG